MADYGSFKDLKGLVFYKVSFINKNIEGLNEYFDRNNDPVETVILCADNTGVNIPDLLDNFLCDVCYCDAYHFHEVENVGSQETKKYKNILYTIREIKADTGDNSDIITATDIYHFNSIIYTMKK